MLRPLMSIPSSSHKAAPPGIHKTGLPICCLGLAKAPLSPPTTCVACPGLDSSRRKMDPSLFHHSVSAPALEAALTLQEPDFQLSTPALLSREAVQAGARGVFPEGAAEAQLTCPATTGFPELPLRPGSQWGTTSAKVKSSSSRPPS